MYPFVRLAKNIIVAKFQPSISVDDVHVSHHICWPWDLDMFGEMNNGITLSVYDLGRVPFSERFGLTKTLRREKWGMAVAGISIRYRRRIHMFYRFELHTKILGYDERFIYSQQTMWRKGEATSSALVRSAVTEKNGIVAPEKLKAAMGLTDWNPKLPAWVEDWIAAEGNRIWPPEF